VEVWNAGTGSVFWLRGLSEPHADRVHWERHAIKHTHSNQHGSSGWVEFPAACWARNAVIPTYS